MTFSDAFADAVSEEIIVPQRLKMAYHQNVGVNDNETSADTGVTSTSAAVVPRTRPFTSTTFPDGAELAPLMLRPLLSPVASLSARCARRDSALRGWAAVDVSLEERDGLSGSS